MKREAFFLIAFWFFFTVVVDQFSKFAAGFFDVAVTLNQGVSFNWLPMSSQQVWIIGLLVVLVILAVVLRKIWLVHPVLAGLFFGGAVSNLIDRARMGGVRDFLPVPFLHLSNNLADWAVVGALVALVYREFRAEHSQV